jgi:predicted metal-dependent hydrolase
MAEVQKTIIQAKSLIIDQKEYPIEIGFFSKKNSSARIRDGIIYLRISNRLSEYQKKEHINALIKKVSQQTVLSKPSWNPLERIFDTTALDFEKEKEHETQFMGTLELNNNDYYHVHFKKNNRKTIHIELLEKNIIVNIPNQKNILKIRKEIEKNLYKIISQDQRNFIIDYVSALNEEFYREDINEIRLKNTKTRWGSCSYNKNINISVKLLFVPMGLLEYVVVHELAHLKEMNHSSRFWKHVENALPDYKNRKRLLKAYQ